MRQHAEAACQHAGAGPNTLAPQANTPPPWANTPPLQANTPAPGAGVAWGRRTFVGEFRKIIESLGRSAYCFVRGLYGTLHATGVRSGPQRSGASWDTAVRRIRQACAAGTSR